MIDLLWICDGALYFRYPKLSEQGRLMHAVFTRQGGVSKVPYDSLNASYAVGDRKHRVEENLRKIRLALGAKRLIFMNQTHGEHVEILRRDRTPEDVPTADAVITNVALAYFNVLQAAQVERVEEEAVASTDGATADRWCGLAPASGSAGLVSFTSEPSVWP